MRRDKELFGLTRNYFFSFFSLVTPQQYQKMATTTTTTSTPSTITTTTVTTVAAPAAEAKRDVPECKCKCQGYGSKENPIPEIFVKEVHTHKVSGFSPVEFDDAVWAYGGLEVLNGAKLDNFSLTGATTANTASAGSQTLPANPAAFLVIPINGTNYKLPLYNN